MSAIFHIPSWFKRRNAPYIVTPEGPPDAITRCFIFELQAQSALAVGSDAFEALLSCVAIVVVVVVV
jgi:hypothetical protein